MDKECTLVCREITVSELIDKLKSIPNKDAIVCRESCGCAYTIQGVL